MKDVHKAQQLAEKDKKEKIIEESKQRKEEK